MPLAYSYNSVTGGQKEMTCIAAVRLVCFPGSLRLHAKTGRSAILHRSSGSPEFLLRLLVIVFFCNSNFFFCYAYRSNVHNRATVSLYRLYLHHFGMSYGARLHNYTAWHSINRRFFWFLPRFIDLLHRPACTQACRKACPYIFRLSPKFYVCLCCITTCVVRSVILNMTHSYQLDSFLTPCYLMTLPSSLCTHYSVIHRWNSSQEFIPSLPSNSSSFC